MENSWLEKNIIIKIRYHPINLNF